MSGGVVIGVVGVGEIRAVANVGLGYIIYLPSQTKGRRKAMCIMRQKRHAVRRSVDVNYTAKKLPVERGRHAYPAINGIFRFDLVDPFENLGNDFIGGSCAFLDSSKDLGVSVPEFGLGGRIDVFSGLGFKTPGGFLDKPGRHRIRWLRSGGTVLTRRGRRTIGFDYGHANHQAGVVGGSWSIRLDVERNADFRFIH